MVLIYGASALPDLEGLPAGISDKTGHLAGYFLLGALVARAIAAGEWSGYTWPTAATAWVFAAAYGVTDEWHQSFVPGRTPDVGDWMADAVGAAAGVLVVTGIARVRSARGRAV